MRVVPFFLRLRVPLVFAVSALWVASTGASTPEELAAAQKSRDDALVALDAAKTALADIEGQLSKLKNELSYEYRVLDEQIRERNREEESKSRATIRSLRGTRDDLWVARDHARLVVSQLEAEAESGEALFRVHELQLSGGADSSQIQQWQRKHEKALAKARRLQREMEAAERPAG